MEQLDKNLEDHKFAYLTTKGRVTGEPHRIEIWFAIIEGAVWVNSGASAARSPLPELGAR